MTITRTDADITSLSTHARQVMSFASSAESPIVSAMRKRDRVVSLPAAPSRPAVNTWPLVDVATLGGRELALTA